MDWISSIPLIISGITLLILGWEVFSNNKNKYIDRQVKVIVDERRKMQKELFKHVTAILSIYRKIIYKTNLENNESMFHDILNHKVNVWRRVEVKL